MRLKEWEGKQLFKDYQIPVAIGQLVKTPEVVDLDFEGEKVVKAQVLMGKRGKSGGIKFANAKTIKKTVAGILGMKIQGLPVQEVLIEDKLEITKEYYMSLTIDRGQKSLTLLFSSEGGMDIEETAVKNPEKIWRISLHEGEFHSAKVDKVLNQTLSEEFLKNQIVSIAEKMFRLALEKDALLVEINPLILTQDDQVVAADSKVVIDDNALFRQKGFKAEKGLSKLEQRARKAGLAYVELEGDTAVIGNGAGLVMATLDMVSHYGGKPAVFLDIGGGASAEKMEQALEIAWSKKGVKKILINVFGGITRGDEVAKGIVAAVKKIGVQRKGLGEKSETEFPIVVRLTGTNAKKGRDILTKSDLKSFEEMEKAVMMVSSI